MLNILFVKATTDEIAPLRDGSLAADRHDCYCGFAKSFLISAVNNVKIQSYSFLYMKIKIYLLVNFANVGFAKVCKVVNAYIYGLTGATAGLITSQISFQFSAKTSARLWFSEPYSGTSLYLASQKEKYRNTFFLVHQIHCFIFKIKAITE